MTYSMLAKIQGKVSFLLPLLSLVMLVTSSQATQARTAPLALASSSYTSTHTGTAVYSIPVTELEVDPTEDAQPLISTKPVRTYKVDMTAYTSSVEECDGDPFVTADGSVTQDGIVATNFLPFGTKVRFPTVFGDRVFEVHDRMNARYSRRIDVWMEDKADMRQFGLKRNATVEILQMGDGKTQWDDPDMRQARRALASR